MRKRPEGLLHGFVRKHCYSEDLNDRDSLILSRRAERLCSRRRSSGMVAARRHFVTLSLLYKLLNRYSLVAFIWALTWRLWIANNLSMRCGSG